jgi:transcriptional regulator with XRE-family HTH domain
MSKKYQPKYQQLLKKLRQARLDADLTQVEVGEKLKKPQAYISKIERGERSVDALELSEFAKLYKKPLDYFVN